MGIEEKKRDEQEVLRKQILANKRRRCFQNSGVFASCTFATDDGHSPRQSAICKKFAETFSRSDQNGLLLYGPVGTGKTYMSSAIANELIERGFTAQQVDFGTIVNRLQENLSERQSVFDSILKCDLLVIEDLGAQRTTEFMMETIYSVIDGRYKQAKPMVVTTNYDYGAMQNVAPENAWSRIFDRILERCYPVEFDGRSRRKVGQLRMKQDMAKRLGID